jgi:hypothetical protein
MKAISHVEYDPRAAKSDWTAIYNAYVRQDEKMIKAYQEAIDSTLIFVSTGHYGACLPVYWHARIGRSVLSSLDSVRYRNLPIASRGSSANNQVNIAQHITANSHSFHTRRCSPCVYACHLGHFVEHRVAH